MDPTKFKEANTVFAENQPPYAPLPAEVRRGGVVVTRWRLGFYERLRVLFGAPVWLHQMSFGQPLQPVFLSTWRCGTDVVDVKPKADQ